MIMFHHTPSVPTATGTRKGKHKPKAKSVNSIDQLPQAQLSAFQSQSFPSPDDSPPLPLTWEESVALLVQQYIPKDEIPHLNNLGGPSSRICGGWVQALSHVDQSNANFEGMLLPAVRALTLSMMVADTSSQQQYLNTYVDALQGIRCRLAIQNEMMDHVAALAGMCLALSEVLMPTSKDGWTSHLRGVAAMMYGQGPETFVDGIHHLLFVGFRPLIVLDAIKDRKPTFLEEEAWRIIPFSKQRSSIMQDLLGYGASIASLLAKADSGIHNVPDVIWSLSSVAQTLQDWETSRLQTGDVGFLAVTPSELRLSADLPGLPDTCFAFPGVASANALTHCWAFRVVCLLEVIGPEQPVSHGAISDDDAVNEENAREKILELCTLICQGLPYLLQQDMGLYGPLSAMFPLSIVSKSITRLGSSNHCIAAWHNLISGHVASRPVLSMYKQN